MIEYTTVEKAHFGQNNRMLEACYFWAIGKSNSSLTLNWANMLKDRPVKKGGGKSGWKKGVKRHYRGKAIREE